MLNTPHSRLFTSDACHPLPCMVTPEILSVTLIKPVWGADKLCFRGWYRPYHALKRALSDDKTVLIAWRKSRRNYKLLIFNNLHKVQIFREFAAEGESARKFAKNKRGRTENSDRKSQDARGAGRPFRIPCPSEGGNNDFWQTTAVLLFKPFPTEFPPNTYIQQHMHGRHDGKT